MPHQITNRRRSYTRLESDGEFKWEALNALVYIVGGGMFLVGSVFFLPALEQYSTEGAFLFILGSLLYLTVTVTDLIETIVHYRHHESHGAKTFMEFATSTGYVVGSLLFVTGSVCFLPSLGLKVWGAWCFIVGSALFITGACINVTQITRAGSLFTLQLLNSTAICFIIGSVLFFVACVPYLWQGVSAQHRQTLFSYLGAEFIFASLLFLAGGLINFYRAYRVHLHYASRR